MEYYKCVANTTPSVSFFFTYSNIMLLFTEQKIFEGVRLIVLFILHHKAPQHHGKLFLFSVELLRGKLQKISPVLCSTTTWKIAEILSQNLHSDVMIRTSYDCIGNAQKFKVAYAPIPRCETTKLDPIHPDELNINHTDVSWRSICTQI